MRAANEGAGVCGDIHRSDFLLALAQKSLNKIAVNFSIARRASRDGILPLRKCALPAPSSQGTKSLRSGPLRGGVSREAGSKPIG